MQVLLQLRQTERFEPTQPTNRPSFMQTARPLAGAVAERLVGRLETVKAHRSKMLLSGAPGPGPA